MPTIVDNLITRISQAHGQTLYHPDNQGKAIKTRVGHATEHHRTSLFNIYSNAAYGSRTSGAPGTHSGKIKYRLRIVSDLLNLDVRFLNGAQHLAKARTPPEMGSFFTVYDQQRHPVIQVTNTALYLLFPLEQLPNPEQVLTSIYESLVIPIDQARNALPMTCFSTGTQRGQTRPTTNTTRTPTPPPPRERPGRGSKWDFYRSMHQLPVDQARNAPSDVLPVIGTMLEQRKIAVVSQARGAEERMRQMERRYNEALRNLKYAQEQLEAEENTVRGLQVLIQKDEFKANDDEVVMLKAVLENQYEKAWSNGEHFWGLTKPVTIKYTPLTNRQHDPFEVYAGRFFVRVHKTGEVAIFREDGRICKERRGWAAAPHISVEYGEGSICWGTQSSMLRTAQTNRDYAQIFLLAYQHLSYVNPEESYVTLRGYAELLELPFTEDPNVLEAQKAAEQQAAQLLQEQQAAAQANIIQEAGELTMEELEAMARGPVLMEVNEEHLDAEMNDEIN